MIKKSLLQLFLVLSIFMLSGCFEKQERPDTGDDSDFLEVVDLSEDGSGTSTGDDDSSSGPIIIVSSTIVPIDKTVTISFSENIDTQTVNANSVYIADIDGNAISSSLSVSANQITIIPTEFFTPDSRYTIVITTEMKDTRSRSLRGLFNYTFPTAPDISTPPQLIRVSPSNGTFAPVSTDITMTFNEDIVGTADIIVTDIITGDTIEGTTVIRGNTISFTSRSDLEFGRVHRVIFNGILEDSDGNSYTASPTWNFTTNDEVDSQAPTLVSTTPADGEEVAVDTYISLSFDETIRGGATLEVMNTTTSTIVLGTLNTIGNQLEFIPQTNLDFGILYSVNIVGDIEDMSGNVYEGIDSWNFNTIASSSLFPPAPDDAAPSLVSFSPTDSETNVVASTDISMTFDESITNVDMVFDVRDTANTPVAGTTTVSGDTITFNPDSDLSSGETYTVNVSGSVEDSNGNAYNTPSTWSFSVADTVAPSLVSFSPTDGESNVVASTDISMTFDESITNVDMVFDVRDTANIPVAGTITVSGDTITFNPDSDLSSGETYTVNVSGSVEDSNGNAYNTPSTWSFSVAVTVAPSLISFNPEDNATGVLAVSDISVTFDENISNDGSLFLVFDNTVSGAVAGAEGVTGDTLWFIPTNDLIEGHQYTVTILGPTYDDANNTYTGQTSWSFTVEDSTAPGLVSLTPSNGQTDANKSLNMTMTFDEDIADNGVALEVWDSNNTLVSGITIVSANTINFNPSNDLEEGMEYNVTVQGTIEDNAGNAFTLGNWSFTIADTTAPTLKSFKPSDGSLNASNDTITRARFSEAIDTSSATLSVVRADNNTSVSGTNTLDGINLKFVPDVNLEYATEYNVTIVGDVVDHWGNVYSGPKNWQFTVLPAVDDVPPSVIEFYPEDNATNVEKDIDEIYVRFDENITNGGKKFTVTDETDNVEIDGTEDVTGDKIWFIPDDNLIPGHDYSVEIHGPATEDLAGNEYTGQTKWYFSVKPLEVESAYNIFGDYVIIDFSYELDVSTFDEDDFLIISDGKEMEIESFEYSYIDWFFTLSRITIKTKKDLDEDDSILYIPGTIEDIDGNNIYDGNTTIWTL